MFKKRLITVDEATTLGAPTAILSAAAARDGMVCELAQGDGGAVVFSARPYYPGDTADGTNDEEVLACLGAFFNHVAANPDRFPRFSTVRHEDLYRQSMRYVAHVIFGAKPEIDRHSLEIGRSMLDGSIAMTGYDGSSSVEQVVRFDTDWPNEEIAKLFESLRSIGQFSLVGLVSRHVSDDLGDSELGVGAVATAKTMPQAGSLGLGI
jgi:hypothetical protein